MILMRLKHIRLQTYLTVRAKSIYAKLRLHIAKFCIDDEREEGEFELDESYFKRVRGKRGRGAAGKTPVFGLLKRDGNVYVEVVKN